MMQLSSTSAHFAAPAGRADIRALGSVLALTSLFLLALAIIPGAGAF